MTSGILFLGIKYTVGLRVTEEEEVRGLNMVEHGVEAYPEFAGVAGLSGVGLQNAAAPPQLQPRSAEGPAGGAR